VVPNGIDLEGCERVAVSREEGTMVFAGAVTFQPNYDAMSWFLAEIYPRIKARQPEARLTISGGGEWRDLPPARDVVRTGVVRDVRPVVASAAVSIAPIRFGAGTRLKVLEAMALRTPVVATTKAVEGLDVEHEKHLLVADTPDEFADAVIRVLCSPQLGCRLAENAFALVKQEYDWKVLEPKIVEVVEAAAQA